MLKIDWKSLMVLGTVVVALPAQETNKKIEELQRENEKIRQQLEESNSRLDELEELTFEALDRMGSRAQVQAFSAESLDFGGHTTVAWIGLNGDHGTAGGHFVSFTELMIRAKISEEFALFTTPGFLYRSGVGLSGLGTPSSTPGEPSVDYSRTSSQTTATLPRAQLEYSYSDALRVKMGVIGSPHGIINREYFVPTRNILQSPYLNRLFSVGILYPLILIGADVHGRLPVGTDSQNAIAYDLYLGVEQHDPSDPKAGMRLAYEIDDIGLSVGVHGGTGRRATFNSVTGLNPVFNVASNPTFPFPVYPSVSSRYNFIGIEADWRSGPWVLKSEAYYSGEEGVSDREGYYVQPTYFLTPEWGVSYRSDYFNPGDGHATEQVLGISFDPNESVRLRLDTHHTELPNSSDSVQSLVFSFSASF